MNWLWFVTLGIIVFFAYNGQREGFIKTVFKIFSLIISIALTVSLSPYVSKTLQNNEKLQKYVSGAVATTLNIGSDQKQVGEQTKAIEELDLPQSLKTALIENNNSEVYKALAINSFKDYVVNYITCIIINAMSFVITFIIINVILIVLFNALNIISKLPIINGLNKTAGLLVGVLHGLIVVWVLCIVLTAFNSTPWGQNIFAMITESKLLSNIYNNNLLLKVITNIAKVLF